MKPDTLPTPRVPCHTDLTDEMLTNLAVSTPREFDTRYACDMLVRGTIEPNSAAYAYVRNRLNQLVDLAVLRKERRGRETYFVATSHA